MYLWDSNILRHFGEQHSRLAFHIRRIGWDSIALPSPVIAEVLQGRAAYALKARPEQAVLAHELLLSSYTMLQHFKIETFDAKCADALEQIRSDKPTRKRYVDCMIAAIAISGRHVLVTRNEKHFADLLPSQQIENWIDR